MMMPAMAKGRHVAVEAREKRLAAQAQELGLHRVRFGDPRVGVITSGIASCYVDEGCRSVAC